MCQRQAIELVIRDFCHQIRIQELYIQRLVRAANPSVRPWYPHNLEDENTIWTDGSRLGSGEVAGALTFFQRGDRQAPDVRRTWQSHRVTGGGRRKTYEQAARSIRSEPSGPRLTMVCF